MLRLTRKFLRIPPLIHWGLLIVLLLALQIRWPGLADDHGFWQDETYSLAGSWRQIGYGLDLKQIYGNGFFPSLTSWVFFRMASALAVFGHAGLIRIPFVALGLLAIVATYWLGLIWRRPIVALLMATSMAVWPFKTYWDLNIRFYAVTFGFCLLSFVAWETYRQRQTWRTIIFALAISLLASQANLQALPLIFVAPVYLIWVGASKLSRAFQRKFNPRPTRYRIDFYAAHLTLLLVVIILCMGLGRGWQWTFDQPRNFLLGAPVTAPAAKTKPEEKEEKTGSKPFELPTLTPLKAITFLKEGCVRMFTPGQISLAPLLGLGQRYYYFDEVIFFYPKRCTQPGDAANITLLIFFFIGAGYLIYLSPPMCFSCLALILGISAGLLFQESAVNYSSRYYAIPGLMIVMLATFGLAFLLQMSARMTERILSRFRITGNGLFVTHGFALAGMIILFVMLMPMARRAAAFKSQHLSDFYLHARKRFPDGVYMLTSMPECVVFNADLAAFAYRRSTQKSNSWLDPLRDVISANSLDPQKDYGWNLLEQAQTFGGVAFGEWGTTGQDFSRNMKSFLSPPVKEFCQPISALYYDLTRHLYITRGRMVLPLKDGMLTTETLRQPAGKKVTYSFDARYEIPGEYDAYVSYKPSNPPLDIAVDGVRVRLCPASLDAFTTTEAQHLTGHYPYSGEYRRNLRHPRLPPLKSQHFIAPTHVMQFLLTTPQDNSTSQVIAISFAHGFTGKRPALIWRRRAEKTSYYKSRKFDIVRVVNWQKASTIMFSPLLRLKDRTSPTLELLLVDLEKNRVVAKTSSMQDAIAHHGQKWLPGDWFLPTALAIDLNLSKSYMSQPYALLLKSGGLVFQPGAIVSNSRPELILYDGQMVPCLARFQINIENGKVRAIPG